jgi:DNA polymerase bacteriophage-type
MTLLWCDTETFCAIDIRVGTYRYMERVELMLLSYALDDAPARVVDLTAGERAGDDWQAAVEDPTVTLVAHGAGFDRLVLGKYRPALRDPRRWRCTIVQALEHSLPGALAMLSVIFKLPADQAKDKDGRELVRLFCKPDRNGNRATRLTHPTEWARFKEYARLDVEAMRAVAKLLPTWNYPDNPREVAYWHLDQLINDRGVAIDADFARAAVATIEREQARLAAATREATGGAVESATQRDALLAHILAEHGVDLPDMQASTLERRMEDENLPEPVRELLALRLAASLTSVGKYSRALAALSSDGRARGLYQFCGANRTGRDAGRIIQPQNFPRPKPEHKKQIDAAIEATKAGALDLVTDEALPILSSSLRGLIIAPPGRKLVVADLSNIEGRFIAWEAGERWKLDAFRAYDAGTGPDIYRLAYSRSFGVPVDSVTDEQRQIGKVQELALGFQGAVGAFSAMAAAYGMESLATEAEVAEAMKSAPDCAYPPEQVRQALHEARVLEIVKAWRKAHPAIVKYWYALEDAARACIHSKGAERVPVGTEESRVWFDMVGTWLRVRLPSGRFLSYPAAQIHATADGEKIRYLGVNQYTRKWGWLYTYGGKFAENITQANAREKFVAAWPHAEAAGYQIVMRSHDELVTETPDSPEFNADALSAILARPVEWAPSLPLAAAGFETYRYRKG